MQSKPAAVKERLKNESLVGFAKLRIELQSRRDTLHRGYKRFDGTYIS
jgi:hypothetical protein